MNHSEQYRYTKKYNLVRTYEIIKSLIASEIKHRVNQVKLYIEIYDKMRNIAGECRHISCSCYTLFKFNYSRI